MTIGNAPMCLQCKHYKPNKDDDMPMTCEAYPDGIPLEIIMGELEHTVELPGDHGVMFEKM